MQHLWIKIYQTDVWHSYYPFVLEFNFSHSNFRCTILKVSKSQNQCFLQLHCPKNQRSFTGQNFVKNFVHFLGNGVSRKNAFEIYWPLQILHGLTFSHSLVKTRQKKFIKLNLMQHFMDQVKSDAIICYG